MHGLRRLRIALVLLVASLAMIAFPGTSSANGGMDRLQGYPPNTYGSGYGGSGYGCWYQIHFGDTLSSIAVRYSTSLFGLMQANGLRNPNLIFAGMALHVPCASSGYPPGCTPTAYIVQPGDDLFRIGLRYGLNFTTLAYYNGLRNVNLIFTGMRLLIPCGYSNSSTPYPMPTMSSTPGATPTPGAGATPTLPSTAQTTIVIQNFAFNPATVTVKVGSTVMWHNNDSVPHTSTSGACPGGTCAANGMWDSGTLSPGQTFSRMFNTTGTFTYYCKIHGAMMQGTVIVTP